MLKSTLLIYVMLLANVLWGQPDTVVLGYGQYSSVAVTTSSSDGAAGESTINGAGFFPNDNSASRFLALATLGYNLNDIESVKSMGFESWIDQQMNMSIPYTLVSKADEYANYIRTQTSNNEFETSSYIWRNAWWQYHMQNNDLLRQRVAFALSELFVISDKSNFAGRGHAFADYYDMLLSHAFGSYRELLERVTFHPAMGVYLTYMRNPKADTTRNIFPDENYAREVMQLFSIGTTELDMGGNEVLDAEGFPIATYNNETIAEFSKIFTGLAYGNGDRFWRGSQGLAGYMVDMKMYNEEHEPGPKKLLNGVIIPERPVVDGIADINDALDNIFQHHNVPPFISKFLIQRLVTANPSYGYVTRVASVFQDNGQGVRGDLGAVVKAILLDEEALSCDNGQDANYGGLKEPFIRYVQILKGLDVYTDSGNTFRNSMSTIYDRVQQRPLASPSVFNFFQSDYQPIGPVEDAGKVAPVFQMTDAQSFTAYVNGVYDWVVRNRVADEYDLYSNEPDANYENQISRLRYDRYLSYAEDDKLHALIDMVNMLFAGGQVSDYTEKIIENMVKELPIADEDDRLMRVKVAIYLVLSSPEYLINK